MARKGLAQANTLRSNNVGKTGYGVVYADEVSGHRTVEDLEALYALYDWQLSASGDNTGNDALGQLWYVVDADGKGNGDLYQLVDWEKRATEDGWRVFTTGTSVDLKDYQTTAQADEKYATKSQLDDYVKEDEIASIENTEIDSLWETA